MLTPVDPWKFHRFEIYVDSRTLVQWFLLILQVGKALITFEETAGSKDNLSFLATMNAFARGQQHSFAQLVLDTMEKLKVEKTKEIYTAAMGCANDVFGEGSLEGGWEWSLGLLTEMRSTEVEVDSVALGVALSVCLRARCWEVALKLAPCLCPNSTDTWREYKGVS